MSLMDFTNVLEGFLPDLSLFVVNLLNLRFYFQMSKFQLDLNLLTPDWDWRSAMGLESRDCVTLHWTQNIGTYIYWISCSCFRKAQFFLKIHFDFAIFFICPNSPGPTTLIGS